jgi:hypothetical protein
MKNWPTAGKGIAVNTCERCSSFPWSSPFRWHQEEEERRLLNLKRKDCPEFEILLRKITQIMDLA